MKSTLTFALSKTALSVGLIVIFNSGFGSMLLAQSGVNVSCKDIIKEALCQLNISLSHKEDFQEEWNFFSGVIIEDFSNTTISKYPFSEKSFFMIDTVILTPKRPYLQEPYNMPDGVSVADKIRNHKDSLYFPFMGNWIVNQSDVFIKKECEEINEIVLPLSSVSDNITDTPDYIYLNALISEIWANKDFVSIEIDYMYPSNSPLYSPGYYFMTVLIFDLKTLKISTYSLGMSSGVTTYDYTQKIVVGYEK